MKNEREVIYNILYDVYNNQAYSNLSIQKHVKDNKIFKRENFIREVVYGVLENDIYLEYVISKKSKTKVDKIHINVLILLKMALYQMIFMEVPNRAAINESVELSKVHSPRSKGFINGVLRNIDRDIDRLSKIEIKDKEKYLSVRYSHPLWLVKLWVREFGYEFTQDLCKANNARPEFVIRYNELLTSREELMASLRKHDLRLRKSEVSPSCIIIDNPKNITDLREYREGLFTIQDESSSLVANIMDPEKKSQVLDLCAAPGGKTTHIAEKMNNTGNIVARDIYNHRLNSIRDLKKRLRIKNISIENKDALILDEDSLAKFDYCLVDAPCTGFGTIRRNPEIKYTRQEKDIRELASIQYKILSNAKEYIKKDGILLYSTCTIGRAENDDIVERFLEENPDFTLMGNKYSNDGDLVKLYPNIQATDGFFIAKMKRK